MQQTGADNQLLAAALWYMRRGCSVIPVRPDKKPRIQWKMHQQQRAEEAQIIEWWKKWPDAGVGLTTGAVSGFVVVDADTQAGIAAIENCLPESFLLPVADTPSGGRHYYFHYLSGLTNRARAMEGVDVRTDGGYIIAPPSKNGKGVYAWCQGKKISDIKPPTMPELLFNKLHSRGDPTPLSRNIAGQTATIRNISLQQGGRDEDLFHIANCLAKGGMSHANIEFCLRIIAMQCIPPFPEREVAIKIQSAMERSGKRSENLTQALRDFVSATWGNFSVTDALQAVTIVTPEERAKVRTILSRMAATEKPEIERVPGKNGWYRKIDADCEKMDFLNAESETTDIWLPFKLHKLVEIMPGNTILISGEPNSGKTGLLLNIIRYNMQRFEVHYFNSEMGASELRKRLTKFDDLALSDWRFHPWERSENFADVIKSGKGKINIIDFLEIHDDFYRVGGLLAEIHRKLKGAIAIVALQKNAGTDTGLGGFRTLEKPRLALAMSPGRLKIVKAKNWRSQENPNGRQVTFKLVGGCNFILQRDWHLE